MITNHDDLSRRLGWPLASWSAGQGIEVVRHMARVREAVLAFPPKGIK